MKTVITEDSKSSAEVVGTATTATTLVETDKKLLDELAKQKDVYLRLAADFDNFKKRTRQESETRSGQLKDAFVLDLLPVVDNLERAVKAGDLKDFEQLRVGVRLTLNQLQQLLQQHGYMCDWLASVPFDPHKHEAIAQEQDDSKPDRTVLAVAQSGYYKGTRVLRPAKVVVNVLPTTSNASHGH